MKSYIQVKKELADSAAVVTYAAANPTQFTIGTIVVAADGSATIIINDAGLGKLMTVAV
jgi:hypothetical protein